MLLDPLQAGFGTTPQALETVLRKTTSNLLIIGCPDSVRTTDFSSLLDSPLFPRCLRVLPPPLWPVPSWTPPLPWPHICPPELSQVLFSVHPSHSSLSNLIHAPLPRLRLQSRVCLHLRPSALAQLFLLCLGRNYPLPSGPSLHDPWPSRTQSSPNPDLSTVFLLWGSSVG